jgi:hypothetical protein
LPGSPQRACAAHQHWPSLAYEVAISLRTNSDAGLILDLFIPAMIPSGTIYPFTSKKLSKEGKQISSYLSSKEKKKRNYTV